MDVVEIQRDHFINEVRMGAEEAETKKTAMLQRFAKQNPGDGLIAPRTKWKTAADQLAFDCVLTGVLSGFFFHGVTVLTWFFYIV